MFIIPLKPILSLNLLTQIGSLLFQIIRSKDKIKDTDATIINSTSIKEPCSFFNYIFINPEQYEFEIYEQIIAHEKIHVKKKHSLDLLLSENVVQQKMLDGLLKRRRRVLSSITQKQTLYRASQREYRKVKRAVNRLTFYLLRPWHSFEFHHYLIFERGYHSW